MGGGEGRVKKTKGKPLGGILEVLEGSSSGKGDWVTRTTTITLERGKEDGAGRGTHGDWATPRH